VAVGLALCILAGAGIALWARFLYYLDPQHVAELARAGEAGIAGCCQEVDVGPDPFWDLIEASRRQSSNCDDQADLLVKLLAERTPDEIIAFDEQLFRRRLESFRWDLWAVAYVIHGGCSNDCFDYFRGWLIAQGRQYFEAALAQAERAADRVTTGWSAQCEGILYVAYQAYEQRTGHELPMPAVSQADILTGQPVGHRWDETELPRLYPELWRRFGW